ncbi:MAG: alpha/beta hydrolase [Aquabacterium sp.]|nr:alpha/beta hydrolase [Aquabacterium sp.]
MADAQDNTGAHRFSALTKMLLENVKRAGFPPIYQLPIAQARGAYKSAVGAMELPHVPLARTENFVIPGPAGDLPARLWADSHEPGLPVLLYLHGGGFVIGDLDTCESMCRQVAAQSGAAVVAVDYRLAPEHKYPAGLEDSWAALNWLVSHGHTVGVDGRRIAVGGDSAGGTLSASVALMARDAGIPLALQALIYPSVQTRSATESFKAFSRDTLLSAELMTWFEAQIKGGTVAQAWHREPLHAPDHSGVAPAWIGLAECDALTDEGKLYAQKLRDAGVPVDLRVWPGVIHDFINMGRFLPEAAQLHGELAAAVKQAFKAA